MIDDILRKIFLLLPTKTLIRFKLVCKDWRSLISDPHFAYLHTINGCHSNPEGFLLHRPKASHYYLLHCRLYGSRLVKCRFPADIVTPTICSVSNGLFLLETSEEYCHVYNPTTRQSKRISLTPSVYRLRMGMTIAFDPLISPHFKIVCVRASPSSGMLRNLLKPRHIEVYDSVTDTWRFYGNQAFVPVRLDFSRGVFWNDTIHWRETTFDLETFQENKKGSVIMHDDRDAVENYVEVNGYLNCIAHFTEENLVEVFELDDRSSDWVLKFHVPLESDKGELSVLGMYWEDEEGDYKLVVYDCDTGKVMICGFEEKVFKELVGVKVKLFYRNGAQYDFRFSFQFLETLAPV